MNAVMEFCDEPEDMRMHPVCSPHHTLDNASSPDVKMRAGSTPIPEKGQEESGVLTRPLPHLAENSGQQRK